MANIFKSKEVYKHVIKPGNVHQLIPVRGVYVANQHRTPYFIDHTISISAISNTPATVTIYEDVGIDVYGPYEISVPSLVVTNGAIDIMSYTKRSLTVYEPYEITNPSLIVTNDTIDIYEYTHITVDVYDNHDVCNCTFVCTNNTMNIQSIPTNYESEIDGFLQITNISSNTATIS